MNADFSDRDSRLQIDLIFSKLLMIEYFFKSYFLIYLQDDEINKHKEEIIKQKDEDSSQNMKVKWAQNKLKQELEAHKVF